MGGVVAAANEVRTRPSHCLPLPLSPGGRAPRAKWTLTLRLQIASLTPHISRCGGGSRLGLSGQATSTSMLRLLVVRVAGVFQVRQFAGAFRPPDNQDAGFPTADPFPIRLAICLPINSGASRLAAGYVSTLRGWEQDQIDNASAFGVSVGMERRECNPNKSSTWAMHPELRTRGGGTIHGEETIEGRVYVCSTDDTAAAAVCAYEDTIFLVPYWNRLFSPICAWVPAECRFVPHTAQ